MTQLIDPARLERATANLKKLVIFLVLIGLALLYLEWFRYPLGDETVVREMVWALRIVSLLILYASLKCYMIARYLI